MSRLVVVTPSSQAEVPVGVEIGARYVLTSLDGRAVFNDPTDLDHVGFITGVSGFDSPEVRESADLIVEGDGGVHGSFFYGRRPWTFEGIIDPTPYASDYDETTTLVATNLVTNPSFEVNTAGWNADGQVAPTLSMVSTWSKVGTNSMRVNLASVAAGNYVAAITPGFGTGGFPITVATGQPVAARATFRVGTAPTTGRFRFTISFWTAAGGNISQVDTFQTISGVASNTEYTLDVTGNVPATAAFATLQLQCENQGASATAIDYNVDAVVFIQGASSVGSYFDGNTYPNGYPQRTAWSGTANASQSYLYNVTRTSQNAAKVSNRRINKLQRASRALRSDSTLAWTPQGGAGVQLPSRRQSLRITERLPKHFLLAMVSADPRIFSQIVNSVSGVAGAATSTLTNQGSDNTPPVVTIRGPASSGFTIFNDTYGGKVQFASGFTLASGDVLVIDFKAKTVVLNGSTNKYGSVDFVNTSWPELGPGANAIRLVNVTGTYDVTWRDAWS